MNTPMIEIALTEVYGERCREPEPGCPVCKAWHELDTLKARISELGKDKAMLEWVLENRPSLSRWKLTGETYNCHVRLGFAFYEAPSFRQAIGEAMAAQH